MRIYGVQVKDSAKSSAFFKTLAETTEGQHLKLSQFGTLCDALMAICYRERGADFLQVSQSALLVSNLYTVILKSLKTI